MINKWKLIEEYTFSLRAVSYFSRSVLPRRLELAAKRTYFDSPKMLSFHVANHATYTIQSASQTHTYTYTHTLSFYFSFLFSLLLDLMFSRTYFFVLDSTAPFVSWNGYFRSWCICIQIQYHLFRHYTKLQCAYWRWMFEKVNEKKTSPQRNLMDAILILFILCKFDITSETHARRTLNLPALGWLPRPRKSPGGSTVKFATASFLPSTIAYPYFSFNRCFSAFSACTSQDKKTINNMSTMTL